MQTLNIESEKKIELRCEKGVHDEIDILSGNELQLWSYILSDPSPSFLRWRYNNTICKQHQFEPYVICELLLRAPSNGQGDAWSGLGWVGKKHPICPNHFWLADPTLFSPIGKAIGCQVSPVATLNHIRKTFNNHGNEDIFLAEEGNPLYFFPVDWRKLPHLPQIKSLIIIGSLLCFFIAALSISCVVHGSLSVPDWQDRSSPQ